MALEIHEEAVGEVRVLGLKGRLDTDTAADLELAAQDLIDAGSQDFVVDLSGVGYVSSAGLRVLLMIAKSIDGKGSLCLCGLNPTVRQVFDVAGFTPLFVIGVDRDAVLKKTKAKPPVADSADSDEFVVTVAKLLAGGKSGFDGTKAAPALVADASRLLAMHPRSSVSRG